MRRFFKILIVLFASSISFGLVAYLFFPQVPLYLWTRYWLYPPNKAPYAYVVPASTIEIKSLSPNDSGLRKIVFDSMEVYLSEAEDADIRNTKNGGKFIVLRSHKGVILDKGQNLHEVLLQDPEFDANRYSKFLGDAALASPFDLCRTALETTPDSVSITSSIEEVMRATVLLIYKSLLAPGDFTKFHFLKIVKAKGILIYHDQDHVRIHLFVRDTNHYEMTMLGFQEQEINTILSHVRFKTL